MQGGMFRSSGIIGCHEKRLLVLKMLNHIANQGVDSRIYLIHGAPRAYRGPQIVGAIEQTLVLCVDHGVAGKGVTIETSARKKSARYVR